MEYIVTHIQWDCEGETVSLPKEMTVDVPKSIIGQQRTIDYISDKITEITNYCHFGFSLNEAKKEIRFDKPIEIECDSMVGKTKLIGVYKTKKSFRAFDEFGNWFTVSKLEPKVQIELSKYIFMYNNKFI